MVLPQTTWFGAVAPVIDGCVENCASGDDLGWRGAYRYIYDSATNGTPLNDIVMQGITDTNNVYLSFEVHKPVAFSDNDLIVVAFDPDGTAAHQQLFEIQPVKLGEISSSNLAPAKVQYWIGSSTFSGPALQGASVPAWVQNLSAKVSTSDGPTDYLYSLEMRIPIDSTGTNGIPLPPATDFGMYLNVIRLNDSNGTDTQAYWPNSADQIGLDLVPPDSSQWGTSSFTGTCNGVSIVPGSITDSIMPAGTNGTTLVMGDGTSNTFKVSVQNTSVSAKTGAAVLAPQIQPTFLIYNLGMPASGQWVPIPGSTNQPQPQDIDKSSTGSFSTGSWTIATGSPDYTFYQANPHQCIQVRLDAKPPSTSGSPGQTAQSAATCNVASPPPECSSASIITDGAVQNMNFASVPMSMMRRGFVAQIGTKGYALPAGQQDQVFDLWVRTQAYAPSTYKRDQLASRIAWPNISVGTGQNLLWTVHGYRHLGKFLKINGKTYETVSYIGGYGYGLTYEGSNPQWRYQFFGENGDKLESLGTNNVTYRMRVKQDQVGYVNAVFEGDTAPAGGSGGPVESGEPRSKMKWWVIALIILVIILILTLSYCRKKHA